MPKKRLDSHISPRIRRRALWLARLNACLAGNLPPAVNTAIQLADIDARGRAVVYVGGGEWAAQLRLQQGMLLAVLKSCGAKGVTAVTVKNRPLYGINERINAPRKTVKRRLSRPTRDLIASTARAVADERLARSLRRLGAA